MPGAPGPEPSGAVYAAIVTAGPGNGDVVVLQGSEYTTDGHDSHHSPGGTSLSDVSPQQQTAGGSHYCLHL